MSHLAVVAVLWCWSPAWSQPVALVLDFNGKVTLEIAREAATQARGLSWRATVPPGTGMLFVNQDLVPLRGCFWMRNTLVPLDAAFVDASGIILYVATMVPLSEDLHCPPRPATWVIEVPAHWFRRQGFVPGVFVGEENLAKLRLLG